MNDSVMSECGCVTRHHYHAQHTHAHTHTPAHTPMHIHTLMHMHTLTHTCVAQVARVRSSKRDTRKFKIETGSGVMYIFKAADKYV